jgi:hypothetical protein
MLDITQRSCECTPSVLPGLIKGRRRSVDGPLIEPMRYRYTSIQHLVSEDFGPSRFKSRTSQCKMLSRVIKELLWAAYASDIDGADVATPGRRRGVSTASWSRAVSHAFNYNDHEQIARTVYTARCYNMTTSMCVEGLFLDGKGTFAVKQAIVNHRAPLG